MARLVDPKQLVGASEIAKRLDLAGPQAIYNWRRRHDDFPEPVAQLEMGLVWARDDVVAWLKAHEKPTKKL